MSRVVVDKRIHEPVFNKPQALRDLVQGSIVEEFKKNYLYNKYGIKYCLECGQPMEFIIDCGDRIIEAAFICRPCGGKEQPQYTNWGYGI